MSAKRKILCIDDEDSTLKIIAGHLATNGYEFVASILGEVKPDPIVLDINMPLISGDRIADIIAGQGYTANVPIILFSGEPPSKSKLIEKRFPGASYVSKESGLDSLVRKIDSALD